MNLLGLSPTTFALGAAGIAAALGALHLLRIRLRRQTVDSLLFFEMLGAVERPRVFLGRPARWLSYLIALIALLALWTVFAEPTGQADTPSRVVLVDASGLSQGKTTQSFRALDSHLRTASDLAASSGLGPNGAVYAIGLATAPLLRAGEPVDLLIERAAGIEPTGPQLGWPDALRTLAATLAPNDEIVVIGAPADLPDHIAGHKVSRAGFAPSHDAGLVGITLRDWPERRLDVEFIGQGECAVTVIGSREISENEDKQTFTLTSGSSQTATFVNLPDTAQKFRLMIRDKETATTIPFDLPARERHPVRVTTDSTGTIIPSVMADAALELATDGTAVAQVIEGDASIDGKLATLRLLAGEGSLRRLPRKTEHCPLTLSLRDRERTSARALKPIEGEDVWVEDALSGAPLIASHILASGVAEVRVVDWLLEDPTHRDVPALLIGSLRMLAGVRSDKLVAAGEPTGTRSLSSASAKYSHSTAELRVLPSAGRARARLAPGTWRNADAKITALPSVATSPIRTETPVSLETLPGRTDWVLWLLCAALLCIGADLWLYHRGRTP